MGLDMYLSAKKTLIKRDWVDKKDLVQHQKIKDIFPEIFDSGNLNTIEVSFEVGYWRKANQIHKWFVDNIQDGEDNCSKYYVGRDKLILLKKTCEKILNNKKLAEKLLPTAEGFFFGSNEYEEYYFEDLKNTIEIIDKCLKLPEGWDFEYQSSW